MRYWRDPLIDQLLRSMVDSLAPQAPRQECPCDDCRIARAHDVTPEGERAAELSISVEDGARIRALGKRLGWNQADIEAFTVGLFGKRPLLLTMREARAVIAHLEEERVVR